MSVQTIREFSPADRYHYDFGACSVKNGYAQVDTKQDASYYGTWANPFERKIVSYCEGDVTVQTAETDAEFVGLVHSLRQWNDDNGYWLGIDALCNEQLIARFTELGLDSLLH